MVISAIAAAAIGAIDTAKDRDRRKQHDDERQHEEQRVQPERVAEDHRASGSHGRAVGTEHAVKSVQRQGLAKS
jgi:hypothetical protein